MKALYMRTVSRTVLPIGHYQSLPTEVDTSLPMMPAMSPRPMEHPQLLTTSAGETIPPMRPANDSTLAPRSRPQSLPDLAERSGDGTGALR